MNDIELIEKLCSAPGAPGFEDEVVGIARLFTEENGFARCRENSLRNLYLDRKENSGEKPVVMIDAHADEVGFMVKSIHANGCLSFLELGSISGEKIQGQRVLVRNAEGRYVPGLVTSKPPHYAGGNQEIYIDVGATSREEAISGFGMRIGEPAVPASSFSYDSAKGLIFTKALDCRIGCAALLWTLKELANEVLAVDIVGTLTSQEEVGTRGSAAAARAIAPRAAIVLEGAPADDTFLEPGSAQTALKKGPMLRHMDKSMISNPRFTRLTLSIAGDRGIAVQEAVRDGGGTNGGPVHLSGDGVPTIVISVPVRHSHSPCGIAYLGDFRGTVELLKAILRSLNEEVISGF